MKKNLEKPSDLKLKGISSDKSQIISVYYSTKPETSSPFSGIANEEEDDTKSDDTKSFCPLILIFLLLKTLFTKIN